VVNPAKQMSHGGDAGRRRTVCAQAYRKSGLCCETLCSVGRRGYCCLPPASALLWCEVVQMRGKKACSLCVQSSFLGRISTAATGSRAGSQNNTRSYIFGRDDSNGAPVPDAVSPWNPPPPHPHLRPTPPSCLALLGRSLYLTNPRNLRHHDTLYHSA